jgi:hypothetical protein
LDLARAFALVDVEIPSGTGSPDESATQPLEFRLDVLSSEEACGYGNVTLDGQVLPQSAHGDVLTGQGTVTTDGRNAVLASWTFRCIKVNNQPDSQFLKFTIDFVDGSAMNDVGFSALFRQTGPTEIINLNTNLRIPDTIAANPNREGLLTAGQEVGSPQNGIDHDLAELDWMYSQLYELKLVIAEKQQAIAEYAYEHTDQFEEDIKDCDSLKCMLAAVVQKVKYTANEVYGKITGHDELADEEFGHFLRLPFKKPYWPKIPPFHPGKGKHGNHTRGRPKGNHIHPLPPHWRKPKHFLPVCRPLPHHKPLGGHGPLPPPHEGPPHGKPPGARIPPPPSPLAPSHQDPFHVTDIERPAPPQENIPPPLPSPKDFDRPQRKIHIKPLQIVMFTGIVFLLALFLVALHRRICTPAKREYRKARREKRRRRRAVCRVARKYAISRFLSRMSGNTSGDESPDDYEEKRAQIAEDSSSEDDMSTTMTEEIASFQYAASIVDDIVSAEEGRTRTVAYAHGHAPHPIPIPAQEQRSTMCDYYTGSQVGDDEQLPAYEDHDSSEMSSVISDGFRYTPGSSDYSPSNSASGNNSNILGPDTKT